MNQRPADAPAVPVGLRVGVLLSGFGSWAGGLDFIRIILNGLLVDTDLSVRLLIPVPTRRLRLRSFLGALWRLARSSLKGKPRWQPAIDFSPQTVARTFADLGARAPVTFFRNDSAGLRQALRTSDVHAVLPAFASLGPDSPVPWVGYIFDFQHHDMPQFFREDERVARDAAFATILSDADAVLVNAKAVRDAADAHFPGAAEKIVCLPFAPAPRREWLDLNPENARQTYALPERYFIVCNQFWVHKDHATAIKAFALFLKGDGVDDVALVCTGGTYDYRAPGHFDRLRALIEQLGIGAKVRMLGHIPKKDQIALLRGAAAVVQPTLYEGGPGGGATYDAVAMGVPALVSDIPVNREITAGDCRFFAAEDAAALARLMREVSDHPPARASGPELLAEAHARLTQLNGALKIAIEKARMAHGSVSPPHPT